jgi:hypothetical protein
LHGVQHTTSLKTTTTFKIKQDKSLFKIIEVLGVLHIPKNKWNYFFLKGQQWGKKTPLQFLLIDKKGYKCTSCTKERKKKERKKEIKKERKKTEKKERKREL